MSLPAAVPRLVVQDAVNFENGQLEVTKDAAGAPCERGHWDVFPGAEGACSRVKPLAEPAHESFPVDRAPAFLRGGLPDSVASIVDCSLQITRAGPPSVLPHSSRRGLWRL